MIAGDPQAPPSPIHPTQRPRRLNPKSCYSSTRGRPSPGQQDIRSKILSFVPKQEISGSSSSNYNNNLGGFDVEHLPVFETVEGYRVAAYSISGEPYLCLPQLLQHLRHKFTLRRIVESFEDSFVDFTSANALQLEGFKKACALPTSAQVCPMIKRSDADRICLELYEQCYKGPKNDIIDICTTDDASTPQPQTPEPENCSLKAPTNQHINNAFPLSLAAGTNEDELVGKTFMPASRDMQHSLLPSSSPPSLTLSMLQSTTQQTNTTTNKRCKSHTCPMESIMGNDYSSNSGSSHHCNTTRTLNTNNIAAAAAAVASSANHHSSISAQQLGTKAINMAYDMNDRKMISCDRNSFTLKAAASFFISNDPKETPYDLSLVNGDNSSRRQQTDGHQQKQTRLTTNLSTPSTSSATAGYNNDNDNDDDDDFNDHQHQQSSYMALRDNRLFDSEAQKSILKLVNAVTSTLKIRVYHKCFGKCIGLFYPALLKNASSHCIECSVCRVMFTPRRFIGHHHGPCEKNICHWGFNSYNWPFYIRLSRKQPMNNLDDDELLNQFKRLLSVRFLSGFEKGSGNIDNNTGEEEDEEDYYEFDKSELDEEAKHIEESVYARYSQSNNHPILHHQQQQQHHHHKQQQQQQQHMKLQDDQYCSSSGKLDWHRRLNFDFWSHYYQYQPAELMRRQRSIQEFFGSTSSGGCGGVETSYPLDGSVLSQLYYPHLHYNINNNGSSSSNNSTSLINNQLLNETMLTYSNSNHHHSYQPSILQQLLPQSTSSASSSTFLPPPVPQPTSSQYINKLALPLSPVLATTPVVATATNSQAHLVTPAVKRLLSGKRPYLALDSVDSVEPDKTAIFVQQPFMNATSFTKRRATDTHFNYDGEPRKRLLSAQHNSSNYAHVSLYRYRSNSSGAKSRMTSSRRQCNNNNSPSTSDQNPLLPLPQNLTISHKVKVATTASPVSTSPPSNSLGNVFVLNATIGSGPAPLMPRFETIEGYRVASFAVAGEPHLCLPQLLQYLRKKFTLKRMVEKFEETIINFTSANPLQLEGFKKACVLPSTAQVCPLIKRSDADWICLELYDQCYKGQKNDIVNICTEMLANNSSTGSMVDNDACSLTASGSGDSIYKMDDDSCSTATAATTMALEKTEKSVKAIISFCGSLSSGEVNNFKKLALINESLSQAGSGDLSASGHPMDADGPLFDSEAKSSLLSLAQAVASTLKIRVYHKCFGKCIGLFYPALLRDAASHCIECSVCRVMFTPRRFIGHHHSPCEKNVCNWGFNSYNWPFYIRLSRQQPMNNLDDDELLKVFKTLLSAGDLQVAAAAADSEQKGRVNNAHVGVGLEDGNDDEHYEFDKPDLDEEIKYLEDAGMSSGTSGCSGSSGFNSSSSNSSIGSGSGNGIGDGNSGIDGNERSQQNMDYHQHNHNHHQKLQQHELQVHNATI